MPASISTRRPHEPDANGTGRGAAGPPMLIELASRLTIAEVAGVREQFLETVAGGAPVTVDASQVSEVDTAGLQLLLALRHAVPAFAWQGISEPVRRAARLLGLEGPLGLVDRTPG